jgi:hypothetical protein
VVGFLSGLWDLVCNNQERVADQQEAREKSTGVTPAKLHVHVSLEFVREVHLLYLCSFLDNFLFANVLYAARKHAHTYHEAVK